MNINIGRPIHSVHLPLAVNPLPAPSRCIAFYTAKVLLCRPRSFRTCDPSVLHRVFPATLCNALEDVQATSLPSRRIPLASHLLFDISMLRREGSFSTSIPCKLPSRRAFAFRHIYRALTLPPSPLPSPPPLYTCTIQVILQLPVKVDPGTHSQGSSR